MEYVCVLINHHLQGTTLVVTFYLSESSQAQEGLDDTVSSQIIGDENEISKLYQWSFQGLKIVGIDQLITLVRAIDYYLTLHVFKMKHARCTTFLHHFLQSFHITRVGSAIKIITSPTYTRKVVSGLSKRPYSIYRTLIFLLKYLEQGQCEEKGVNSSSDSLLRAVSFKICTQFFP